MDVVIGVERGDSTEKRRGGGVRHDVGERGLVKPHDPGAGRNVLHEPD